jgi:hypothetical protein
MAAGQAAGRAEISHYLLRLPPYLHTVMLDGSDRILKLGSWSNLQKVLQSAQMQNRCSAYTLARTSRSAWQAPIRRSAAVGAYSE